MKYIKYYTAVCVFLFVVSCADDKGNYNYSNLNDVIIEKINERKPFIRTPGESLKIDGNFSRKLDSSNDKLSYLWIINHDTVSIDKNLNYEIPEGSEYGNFSGKYIVIDNNSGMRYFERFNLNIRCPYGYGYYVLCKESNNTSRVYFLPSKNKDAGFDSEEKFISTSKIGEYELGPEPSNIAGKFDLVDAIGDYTWILYFTSSGNENNIIKTTSATMLPTIRYNTESFYDGNNRDLSKPRVYFNLMGDPFVESLGKIMIPIEQYLYRPAKHKQEYYWTNSTPMLDNSVTAALDKLSGKFFILTPERNDPATGTTTDKYAIDKVTAVDNCPDYSNHSIIEIRVEADADYVNYFFIVTSASSKGISIDTIKFDSENYTSEYQEGVVIKHTSTSNKIKGVSVGNKVIDWYFVIDNSVYSSPNILHNLTKLADLPKNIGEVIDVKSSTEFDHIVVTMYNSAIKKGSLVKVWLQSGKVDVFENVMSEPISLLVIDGNPSWF